MYRALLLLLVACHVDADPAQDDTAQDDPATDICPVVDPCQPDHTEHDRDGDGAFDDQGDYTYDADHLLVLYEGHDAMDVLLEREEHTYVDRLERTATYDNDGDGDPESTTTYDWTLGDDGAWSVVVTQVSTGGRSTVATIHYDLDRRPVASDVIQSVGGASYGFQEAWTYDERGHEVAHRVTAEAPVRSQEELYTWDEDGRQIQYIFRYLDEDSPIKSITTTWDGCHKASTSTVEDGEVTNCTYNHDELGRRTRYAFRNKGGALQYDEAWTWVTDQEYSVAVDDDGDEQPDYIHHHIEDERGNTLLFEQLAPGGALLTSSAATWICR